MSPAPLHQVVARVALAVPWAEFWNRRERAFLNDMISWRRPSARQCAYLDRLAARANRARQAEGL